MKAKEIREIETKDLAERIAQEVKEYDKMKFNHSITPLKNPSEIRTVRRNIARMKTILREKELNK